MHSQNIAANMPVDGGCSANFPLAIAHSSCQHDVQFYFDDRFLLRSVAAITATGLEKGKSSIIVATRLHREGLAEELERGGINLTQAIEQGRYVALEAAEVLAQFTVNGALDEERFRDVVGKLIICSDAAARSGNPRLVIFGEMVALLWQRGEPQAALQLEQFWNRLGKLHSFHLLCGYPLAGFDRQVHTELFSRICSEHHMVIPAEGYPAAGDENEHLRMVARLQQTEQVLKTEAEERRKAQVRTLEVQSRNEKLLNEIQQREMAEEELRRFTRRLLTARDEEQRRIAAELHENTAQLLSALSLYFGVLNEEKASLNPRLASVVASSRSVSDKLLSEIRKLSHLLHPPTLDDMGLASTLREYVEQFNTSSRAHVDLQVSDNLGRFSRKLEITVFRIVEEALTNIYPHSEGCRATVRLTRSPSDLLLDIEHHQSAGSGEAGVRSEARLMGIHARVMEQGGTVQSTSDPSGTRIAVKLPLKEAGSGASKAASPSTASLLSR